MEFELPDVDDILFDFSMIKTSNCCIASNMVQENDNIYICKICHKIDPDFMIERGVHEDNAFNSIAITGKDAYKYRKIIHSNTSYSTTRDKNTIKQFNKFDNENRIPKDVMRYAIELYIKIQTAGVVLRAKKREGAMAQCIFYAYNFYKQPKSIKDISKIINVSEECMRTGDEILIELNNKQIINIDVDQKSILHYLKTLEINPIYENIINEFMDIKLYGDNSNTIIKCIGILFYLNRSFVMFKKQNILVPLFVNGTCMDVKNFKSKLKSIFNIVAKKYITVSDLIVEQRCKIKNICIANKIPYPVKRKNQPFKDYLLVSLNKV